ncbi:MAG: hypothetical protein AMXMBFR84_10320 [Candidatus Hydrogenedentota bacterium]
MVHAVLLLIAAALPGPVLSPDDIDQPVNVVVRPDLPSDGIILQPKDPARSTLWSMPAATRVTGGKAEIWYQRVDNSEAVYEDKRTFCIGELADGVWSLPAIQPSSPAWGGPNNVVLTRSPHKPTWGGFNVFQMAVLDGRFTLLYWDQPSETGEAGAMIATSANGREWNKEPGTVFTEHNDAYCLLKTAEGFLLYQTKLEDWPDKPFPDNLNQWKRVQSIRSSSDLRTWTAQEVFLRPDDHDPVETEFYLMKAFAYGNGYLGLIMKYFADPNLPNKHSAILKYELVASRDGRHWERPYRGTDLKFWSYADPFTLDGKTHFAIWDANLGMRTVWYEEDRMVGIHADGAGSFVTKPFVATGAIRLNANAKNGSLSIEVLDELAEPLTLYAPMRFDGQDGTSLPVVWPSPLPEKPIRLRITLADSTYYGIH